MHSTQPESSSTSPTPADQLTVVLGYRARGWCVTDAPWRTKHPGRVNWENERPTADELRGRFGHALKNISLLTGAPSAGLVDVDFDRVEAVHAGAHFFPDTRAVFGRAGRRRAHRLYQLAPLVEAPLRKYTDPVLRVPNPVTGKDKPLVLLELRGDRVQTIIPLSGHEGTGELIEWDEAGDPAPVTFEALETAAAATAAVAMLGLRWPKLNGSRHDGALALCGLLLRGGMALERAERILVALADAADCHERAEEWVRGLHDTAARLAAGGEAIGARRLIEQLGEGGEKVVTRLRTWLGLTGTETAGDAAASAEPVLPAVNLWGTLFDLERRPPFPLEVLPPWLVPYVADVAERLGCGPALVAVASLGVAAGAIDDRHLFQLHPDDPTYCVSARLWLLQIADPGDGKSPAQDAARKALDALEQSRIAAWEAAKRRHAAELLLYRRRLAAWEKAENVGAQPEPPPELPGMPRVVVMDFTPERLADVLVANVGGVLVHADELSGFIGSLDAYRPRGVHADRSKILQLFDGRSRVIHRKSGDTFVPNWGASILGGIQPEKLAPLMPALIDDGFLARFLFHTAEHADLPQRRAPDLAALARWDAVIGWLGSLVPDPERPIVAAPGVAAIRETLGRAVSSLAAHGETGSAFRSALAKFDSQWGRLALTFHMLATPGTVAPMLGEATAIAAAELLVDFFIPHMGCHYTHNRSEAWTDARWIGGWILAKGHPRITAREILRAYRALQGEPPRLAKAVEVLETHGWLTAVAGTRRDSLAWTVNPAVHEAFAARAAHERAAREAAKERIRATSALWTHDATEED